MYRSLLFITFTITSILSYTQEKEDLSNLSSFVKNVNLFNQIYPQEKAYLHFDNTSYFLGETMWFKAYVIHATSFSPTNISKILYVELLNDAGIVLETKKLKIEDGGCSGEFKLKEKYSAGFYQVRAYTRYMLNFGNEKRELFLLYNKAHLGEEAGEEEWVKEQTAINDGNFCMFSRVFPIYDKPQEVGQYETKGMSRHPRHTALSFPKFPTNNENDKKKKKEKKYPINIKFYPEGGNLITNVESRVAFEATLENGKRIPIAGSILNSVGQEVVNFKAEHKGRGMFTFCPDGNKYTAIIYNEDERYEYELPASMPTGYVMKVDPITDKNLISISIQKSSNIESELLGITVLNRGEISLFDTLSIIKNQTMKRSISLDRLKAGVNQITLFNQRGEILSERLFFVEHAKNSVSLKTQKTKVLYEPFELIELDFDLSDSKGNPLQTAFSVSVSDDTTRENTYYSGNIYTDLLLSSDIKGYIEDVSSYFSMANSSRQKELDLLMLVQGWRRYDWKDMSDVDNFQLKYLPEPLLLVDGHVINENSKKAKPWDGNSYDRMSGVEVNMNMRTDSLHFESVYITDDKGYFSFLIEDELYGTASLTLEMKDKGKIKKNYYAIITRSISPDIEPYSYYETHFPATLGSSFSHTEYPDTLLLILGGEELEEVTVETKKIKRKTIHYEYPDIVLDVKEEIDLAIDRGILPHAYSDHVEILLTRFRLHGFYEMISDNTQKRTIQYVFALQQMQTVKIYTNQLTREKYATKLHGRTTHIPDIVFAIIPYPEGIKRNDDGGIRQTTFKGYSYVEEFYNPDYSDDLLPDLSDYRRTLYWKPKVETDEFGKAKIYFYNNSSCKKIHISAEGITKDGIPFAYQVSTDNN